MADETGSSYLMEHSGETARLELKTDERATEDQLRLVGLEAGMRVLDAGSGSAAVTRTMSSIVGPSGLAVALDGSLPRLADGARLAARDGRRVSCTVGDIHDPPFGAAFDLVWSRFAVEYLARPSDGLEALLGAVAPGGKLVVGEVDGHGLFHHPIDPAVQDGLDRVVHALEGHWDPYMGRKLYHLFTRLDVESIRVHQLPYHSYPGVAPDHALANWSDKFTVIRPIAAQGFESEADYDRFVGRFMAMLEDPEVFTYSVLFLVEARRQGGGGR